MEIYYLCFLEEEFKALVVKWPAAVTQQGFQILAIKVKSTGIENAVQAGKC